MAITSHLEQVASNGKPGGGGKESASGPTISSSTVSNRYQRHVAPSYCSALLCCSSGKQPLPSASTRLPSLGARASNTCMTGASSSMPTAACNPVSIPGTCVASGSGLNGCSGIELFNLHKVMLIRSSVPMWPVYE